MSRIIKVENIEQRFKALGVKEELFNFFNKLQERQTIDQDQFHQFIIGNQIPEELSLRIFTVFASEMRERKSGSKIIEEPLMVLKDLMAFILAFKDQ